MAIQVTCPSCLKRFSVSDKFAGKSGPCPSCQKTIKIPEKADDVVIHAPDDAVPKDSKGRSILKPIRRKEIKLPMSVMLAASLGTLVVFGLALGLGLSGGPPGWLLVAATVLLALPLVFVGYWFLHDDELEGFRGRSLMVRCGICGLTFAAIWAVYVFVPRYLNEDTEITRMQVLMLLPLMIAIGTAASVLTLELEIMQGILHYVFYLGITFLLAWLSGAPLRGPSASESSRQNTSPPPAINPAVPPGLPGPPNKSSDVPQQIPNLLQ